MEAPIDTSHNEELMKGNMKEDLEHQLIRKDLESILLVPLDLFLVSLHPHKILL
jgi:hypothetical protein